MDMRKLFDLANCCVHVANLVQHRFSHNLKIQSCNWSIIFKYDAMLINHLFNGCVDMTLWNGPLLNTPLQMERSSQVVFSSKPFLRSSTVRIKQNQDLPKFMTSIYTTGAAHHSTGMCTHLHTKLCTPFPPQAQVLNIIERNRSVNRPVFLPEGWHKRQLARFWGLL